ncbi:MAG: Trk system potassium transporter TrkA [Gammaproteobacteria bacterium]|nr:MAG: Trk system potassium transporter TrkA [Gammaproteobacteria bacterium]
MKIIILGAGQVGGSLALSLANENNDITLVDTNATVLQDIQDRADLRTIAGEASHPSVLSQAGAKDADMIIALTNSDETNMVACQVAYTLFHTPTKIARIRAVEYLAYSDLFVQEALPVDVLISPEHLISQYIQRLIEHPGSLQVLDFAEGKVKLLAMRAELDGPLIGKRVDEIWEAMPETEAKVVAIYRNNKSITLHSEGHIQADDEVFFLASSSNAASITAKLRGTEKPYKRILLAGGGNIGLHLAKSLENKYQVKIIERFPERASYLSEALDKTIVLQGDAADQDMLREENIENMDVFCALTNDDEANILSAMLAKRLGANKVMSLINRPSYVDLVESGMIDIAISPQQVTLGTLLTHVRKGDIVSVHSLRRGAAETIEAVAHGDKKTSKVVGRNIEQINLPNGATIGAIVRGEAVIMAEADIIIESEDHVIIFLADKTGVKDIERLFQVSATFI